jgi:hypothetical protein
MTRPSFFLPAVGVWADSHDDSWLKTGELLTMGQDRRGGAGG